MRLWLMRPYAVGTACACGFALLSILTGRADAAINTSMSHIAPGNESSAALPNWGTEAFLMFGYCWFLTRTLAERRLASWNTAGLVACCELWLHLIKSTVFGIIPTTMVVVLLMVRKGKRTQMLVSVAVALGVVVAGAMVANTLSHGALGDRLAEYVARRFFHVESLRQTGLSIWELMASASAGRLTVIWPEALERFSESFLVGCGFNQEFGAEGFPIHNAYLDVLVGVGLLGSLPIVLGFVRWFRVVGRALRLPENTLILVPCVAYVVAILAIEFGDLLRYYSTPLIFLGFVLGIAMKVALLPPERTDICTNWPGDEEPPPLDD